jgi:hypothetical protein
LSHDLKKVAISIFNTSNLLQYTMIDALGEALAIQNLGALGTFCGVPVSKFIGEVA